MSNDNYATGGFLSKPLHISHAEEDGVIPLYGKVTPEDIARIVCIPAELLPPRPTRFDIHVDNAKRFADHITGWVGTWKRNP